LPAALLLAAIMHRRLIGLFQGTFKAYLNIPAFIVTLGGLLAWRGAVKGITQSETIPIADPIFKSIGQSYIPPQIGWILAGGDFVRFGRRFSPRADAENFETRRSQLRGRDAQSDSVRSPRSSLFIYVMNSYAGIPIPVLILLAVALFGVFITNFTTFGRYLYAIGGNADAARLSGINNKQNILKVFALLGALTGIAALIFTARVGSASPDAGTLKELDAIAACVIGGASLMGGRGTIFGACLGALIMASSITECRF
jgi:D-xylose transport system permease protein